MVKRSRGQPRGKNSKTGDENLAGIAKPSQTKREKNSKTGEEKQSKAKQSREQSRAKRRRDDFEEKRNVKENPKRVQQEERRKVEKTKGQFRRKLSAKPSKAKQSQAEQRRHFRSVCTFEVFALSVSAQGKRTFKGELMPIRDELLGPLIKKKNGSRSSRIRSVAVSVKLVVGSSSNLDRSNYRRSC